MKKVIPILALTAFTVLGATSACAQEQSKEREKRDVYYGANNEHATGGTHGNSYDTSFNVQDGYGHGKLYVRNNGKDKVIVSVERESDNRGVDLRGHVSGSSGVVYVPPGESKVIYTNKPTGTGDHRIQLSSSNAALDATFSYKYSNDRRQLN
jgi:hypothetical protein